MFFREAEKAKEANAERIAEKQREANIAVGIFLNMSFYYLHLFLV